MIRSVEPICRGIGLLLLALSGSVLAWTPYGDPPPGAYAGQQPGTVEGGMYGYPPPYGPPGYPFPPMMGPDEDVRLAPVPGPDAGIPGGSPDMPMSAPVPGGLRLTPEVTDDAYLLTIGLAQGADPAAVQVQARGRSLIISTDRSVESSTEQQLEDGRGFSRSYRWSSGRSSRRVPVPPDGDLGAMQREDGSDGIRIVIPRRQP